MAKGKLRKNRIAGIALIAFTLYVVVSLAFINHDIKAKQEESAQLQAEIDEKSIMNEEIQDRIEKGIDAEYIIKIAREQLNFVFPDERVYRDMN